MNVNNSITLEVCVDSIPSGVNAAEGKADRIELCSALSEGGLTPSLGTFTILKSLINIPIFVMLRPHRAENFWYQQHEIDAMKHDAMLFKDAGADGFVFGILNTDLSVNEMACNEILEVIRPLPATFHRAFDCVEKPVEALHTLIDLGFQRVLTSGQKESAIEGCDLIRKLVDEAKDRIVVMPGGGVRVEHIRELMVKTGAREVHGSFRGDETNGLRLTHIGLLDEVIQILARIDKNDIEEESD